MEATPEQSYLFEVSWEVCNKVGGINTVLLSKAPYMTELYSNYYLVGPYFLPKLFGEFEEVVPPDNFKAIFAKLREEGIICHMGRWLVKGSPMAILVDFTAYTHRRNEIKAELWKTDRIDSLQTEYFSFDEPVIWAYAVGRLLRLCSEGIKDSRIIAQMHEWLSGAALLYLKSTGAPVATVFTTHATMLGRTLASLDVNIYDPRYQPDAMQEAYKHNIHAKHQMEMSCAAKADAFTTVSDVTAIEAEKLIGRKCDVVLPNGLSIDKFPTFEEASVRHAIFKRKLKEFILYYFFPYYSFELDDTLIYFLCGRYEFHDKGIDIFLKALANLNESLKKSGSSRTVVAFFWVPGNVRAIKPELLESKTFYQDIKDSVVDNMDDIKERIIRFLITQKACSNDELLGKDLHFELKPKVLRLRRKGLPPVATHDLYDEATDPILTSLRQLRLTNSKEDRVKVVFYPVYLTGTDRLLDMSYYEAMQGSHLGVFPSYYEPWGYTPLEAGALGVSAVTTDLSGFGKYIAPDAQRQNPGIYVLKRMNRSDEDAVRDLSDMLLAFANLSKEDRIKNKIEAQHMASHADWRILVKHYLEAHRLALSRRFPAQ